MNHRPAPSSFPLPEFGVFLAIVCTISSALFACTASSCRKKTVMAWLSELTLVRGPWFTPSQGRGPSIRFVSQGIVDPSRTPVNLLRQITRTEAMSSATLAAVQSVGISEPWVLPERPPWIRQTVGKCPFCSAKLWAQKLRRGGPPKPRPSAEQKRPFRMGVALGAGFLVRVSYGNKKVASSNAGGKRGCISAYEFTLESTVSCLDRLAVIVLWNSCNIGFLCAFHALRAKFSSLPTANPNQNLVRREQQKVIRGIEAPIRGATLDLV